MYFGTEIDVMIFDLFSLRFFFKNVELIAVDRSVSIVTETTVYITRRHCPVRSKNESRHETFDPFIIFN